MKKSIYFLMMFLGLALTSCEPMEEINDEIDTSLIVKGNADLTLSEDDYTALELDEERFMNLEEAKALIPGLLSKKYPAFTDESLATVHFNLFAPVDPEAYTVTAEDYAAAGLDNEFFSSEAEIYEFLSMHFDQAQDGKHVDLTYNVVSDEIVFTLEYADYSVIKEELGSTYPDPAANAAKYGSFTVDVDSDNYWSDDMIMEALGAFISEEYGDVKGQQYNVTYKVYNGSYTEDRSMSLQYNGNNYIAVGGTAYEMNDDDYDFIGAEFADTYAGPAENVAKYGSFDKRSSSDNYWSDSMLLEAINALLMEKFPDAEEGAQFAVSYDIYDGSVKAVTTSVILSGGSYIIDDNASISTIQTNSVFAKTNGSWGRPLTLPENIYTEEFGQRYNNLDDDEEVGFYISRYLEPMYPYAEDGDMVSVAFDFYDGGLEKRYGVFTYKNREWVYTPRTKQATLQFGYDGVNWVPDNTIQYTFTSDDYALVASELESEYPAAAGNLDNYGNFNRTGGGTSWSDEMMIDAINIVLDNLNPGAEIGQKYSVSYVIYAGGYSEETKSVIKTEDNIWVYN
ncbi:hypothetical protein GCM10023115_36010 [Pontixanthobacter gangjinensis]|uniref:DUF5017 domain-containing protein n=1 Tax=Christiangramia aestuarii TaxID=1028746 RepID=A0A7K1LQZ4_9FLAO|nr:hypothetical protein [Christiangramia aestuarii]MUP43232.1 hypothetical protein [Christiangramia aestuarii]